MSDGNEMTRASALEFTHEQRQMIRDAFANGASDAEFAVLMEIAKTRRLNPLLRQIHFVKRWNNDLRREVWTAQAAIDGLRAVAQRTGLYAGQDEPEFVEGPDGTLLLCKVRVYRTDWHGRPAVGVAYWSEYVQTYRDKMSGKTVASPMWAKMPHVMLAKVAESIALRKAFPEDLGGIYSGEEMAQADNDHEEPREARPRELPATTNAPTLDMSARKVPDLAELGIERKPAARPASQPPPAVEVACQLDAEDIARVVERLKDARSLATVQEIVDQFKVTADLASEAQKAEVRSAARAARAAIESGMREPPPDGIDPEPPTPPRGGRKNARTAPATGDATSAPVEGATAPANSTGATSTFAPRAGASADEVLAAWRLHLDATANKWEAGSSWVKHEHDFAHEVHTKALRITHEAIRRHGDPAPSSLLAAVRERRARTATTRHDAARPAARQTASALKEVA